MAEIPDEALCRRLMDRYAMLPNIVEHSFRVCQLACFLGRMLGAAGTRLDLRLIRASALLHDITKTRSLTTKENHAESGGRLLEELGYPEVAAVVRGHVRLADREDLLRLGEVHVVNYADKRVRHDQVVSLEERFEDLVMRYGLTPARRVRLRWMKEAALRLERRLFVPLPLVPEDLQAFNELSPFDLVRRPSGLEVGGAESVSRPPRLPGEGNDDGSAPPPGGCSP